MPDIPAALLQKLSGHCYRAVIIPDARVLSEATVQRLHAFAKGGGHVLSLKTAPAQISGRIYLNGHSVNATDFSWAMIVPADLGTTPTPPAYPPTASPESQRVSPDVLKALHQAIPSEDLKLDSPSTALRYVHRKLADATVFLLFNESSATLTDSVTLHAPGRRVQLWDAQTASVKPARHASVTKSGVELPLQLAPYSTEVIVVH